jgi:hypothetical protein
MSQIERTESVPFFRLFSANQTGAIPSALVPTTTEPTGDGVFSLPTLYNSVSSFGSLIFYGAGTAGNTGSAQVYLWQKINDLWIPTLLLDLVVTLGSAVGIAGQSVVATDKFVNTIAANNPPTTTNAKDIQSPATTSGIAKVDFDITGAMKIQVLVGNTSTTNLNALFKTFS